MSKIEQLTIYNEQITDKCNNLQRENIELLQENSNLKQAFNVFINKISELEMKVKDLEGCGMNNQVLAAKVEIYEKVIDARILNRYED